MARRSGDGGEGFGGSAVAGVACGVLEAGRGVPEIGTWDDSRAGVVDDLPDYV